MVGRRSNGSRKGEEGEAGELADGVLLENFCAAGKEKRPTGPSASTKVERSKPRW